MKKCLLFSVIALFAIQFQSRSQSVGIGTTTPDASSQLQVQRTTKGFLTPRRTVAQRNAIVNPATGLIIFQTDVLPGFYYNNGTPATPSWLMLFTSNNGWGTTGNSGTNPATNFLGTTDNQP